MPAIPTYQSGESSRTGSIAPRATPGDFGADIGQSLEGAGQHMTHGAMLASHAVAHMDAMSKEAKKLDDNRWAANSYEQEKKLLAEFMADPKNNQAEDFAKRVENFSNERFGQYVADSAPSPEALKLFQENYNSHANDRTISALDTGYRNKVVNSMTDVGNQVADAVSTYRNAKTVPGSDGIRDLTDSIAHIGANIESSFRKFSPNIADKLQANLMTESVLASMVDNPKAARALLASSDAIDEQTRRTLSHEIDQSFANRNRVEIDSFNSYRNDRVAQAQQGKNGDKIDIDRYEQFFPADQAQVHKNHDDYMIDVGNKTNAAIASMAPQAASYQLKTLADMRKNRNGAMDDDVYSAVAKLTHENLALQDKNPVGWLQTNNPQVSHAMQDVAQATPDNQAFAIKQLNDAVLKYQGNPPPGTSDEERKWFLNRPLNDRHLMRQDEAEGVAQELNQSNPNEFLKKMGDILARYPDQGHQYTAFADMVNLPSKGSGLRQEYQLAWQNKDAWWLDNYLGAVANTKNIVIPDAADKDLTKLIDNSPTWKQFQSAMVGDNFGRGEQIAGFRSGIQMFAQALIAQGKPTKQAGERAVEMLISSTMGFTKVNGRPLMILREQGPGMQHRSNDEVSDIGRRLGRALDMIDPREIDQSNFASLRLFGNDESYKPRLDVLQNSIVKRAFFQTGNDGQSASLYYADDNGAMFQVRDKSGNPFNVAFKDLPTFTPQLGNINLIDDVHYGSGVHGRIRQTPPQDAGNWKFANENTNFPTTPEWLKAKIDDRQQQADLIMDEAMKVH